VRLDLFSCPLCWGGRGSGLLVVGQKVSVIFKNVRICANPAHLVKPNQVQLAPDSQWFYLFFHLLAFVFAVPGFELRSPP
jgi:hypothetical protein